ncbi:MAG: Addiction module antitoxin, RelB/DinJ family [Candidatus Nomurabacteria bacterium]|nr:Addiction module antitoxin, RelB/DinJ family [Candidatus Nomurabacteria bacterium]
MTTTLQLRIDEKLKTKAQKVFEALGLDLSSGIKLFLTQVAHDKELPFTPSTRAKEIRMQWDKEVAEALKHGKKYTSTKEMFDDILK